MWKHQGLFIKSALATTAIETLQYKVINLAGQELADVFNDHFVNLTNSVDGTESCKYIEQKHFSSILFRACYQLGSY